MGLDFIRRAAKTFEKKWDEGRKELGTSDLFTREPSCVGRSAPFEIAQNVELVVGEIVTIEKDGSALIARQRLAEVARSTSPPPDLVRAVEESCGVAKGTIEQLHSLSGVVEIFVC